MLTLLPTRLHWIKDDGIDDPCDFCAHSLVQFEIEGQQVTPADVGDITVSAAAIYLLRTLESDHVLESETDELLFPHCGHAMYDTGDQDVTIVGCPNGFDVSVIRNGETVSLGTEDGRSFVVSFKDWRPAVFGFSDHVRAFYKNSLPKTFSDKYDERGFERMWSEWDRRRSIGMPS